jgi:hypothetical protein
LTGTARPGTKFTGDDLGQSDPNFQPPRFAQYLNADQQLDDLAQKRRSLLLPLTQPSCSASQISTERLQRAKRPISSLWKGIHLKTFKIRKPFTPFGRTATRLATVHSLQDLRNAEMVSGKG